MSPPVPVFHAQSFSSRWPLGWSLATLCQLLDSFLCPLSTNSNVERDLFFTLNNLQAVGKFYVLLRK